MPDTPFQNPDDSTIRRMLQDARTVAVVGLSDKPDRPSHRIAAYLQQQGYRIIPVNPVISETLGEKAYANLRDVPGPIDIVDIFRKPEDVPAVIEDAIATGARAVWMQSGIVHEPAAKKARDAGLAVVMDHCIMVAHGQLL